MAVVKEYLKQSSISKPMFASITQGFKQAYHGGTRGTLQQYIMARAAERAIENEKKGLTVRNILIRQGPLREQPPKSNPKTLLDYIRQPVFRKTPNTHNVLHCTQAHVSCGSNTASKSSAVSKYMGLYKYEQVEHMPAVYCFMNHLDPLGRSPPLAPAAPKLLSIVEQMQGSYASASGKPAWDSSEMDKDLKSLLTKPEFRVKKTKWVSVQTHQQIVDRILLRTKHKVRQGELVKRHTGWHLRIYKGGISKRKNFRPSVDNIVVPGMRYCSMCEQMLPLEHFRTKLTRAVCTKCWSRAVRKAKLERWASRPYDFDAEEIRNRALVIAQKVFKHQSTPFSVQDARLLCVKYKLSQKVWRVLPRDPRKPTTRLNFVVVTMSSTMQLMQLWNKDHDTEAYMKLAAELEEKDNYRDPDNPHYTSVYPTPLPPLLLHNPTPLLHAWLACRSETIASAYLCILSVN